MNLKLPKKIAFIGGLFILLSGILNTILGLQIGAIYYYPYPGEKMGHVGIIAGLIAILIGVGIIYFLPRLYRSEHKRLKILGGILTIVLGHLGAIFGALYVGTVGVLLCYIGGIWLWIGFIRSPGEIS